LQAREGFPFANWKTGCLVFFTLVALVPSRHSPSEASKLLPLRHPLSSPGDWLLGETRPILSGFRVFTTLSRFEYVFPDGSLFSLRRPSSGISFFRRFTPNFLSFFLLFLERCSGNPGLHSLESLPPVLSVKSFSRLGCFFLFFS